MSVAVEPFDGPADEWDAFVAAHGAGTHAHRYGWKRVVEEVYGHPCPFLCARDGAGRLAGVLPLADVRTRAFGRFLFSMPYLSYGGPLGDAGSSRALVRRAAEMARARGAALELHGASPRAPAPAHEGLRRVDEKVTCVLELPPGGGEALQRGFPSKLRSQLRRAPKDGATVRWGAGELEGFFAVFARAMRDLGTPTHPPAFFAAVARALGDDAWVGCVRLDGRPVAAGLALRHGGWVEVAWAGALREASASAPNMLLYGELLRRAADEGAAVFDFGRCTPGSGTHRFKRQWGARDLPLVWHRAGGAADVPSPERGGYALARRLWRRLPLSLANRLGPALRGGIPL